MRTSRNKKTGGSLASKASATIGRHISIAVQEIDNPSLSRHETDESTINSNIVGEEANAAFCLVAGPSCLDTKARTTCTSTYLVWFRRLLSSGADAAVGRARLVYFAVFAVVLATTLLLIIDNNSIPSSKDNTGDKEVKLRKDTEDPPHTLPDRHLSTTSNPRDPLLATKQQLRVRASSAESSCKREAALAASTNRQYNLHVPHAKLIGENSVWVGGGVLAETAFKTTISRRTLWPSAQKIKRQNPRIGWGLGGSSVIISAKPINCQANQTADMDGNRLYPVDDVKKTSEEKTFIASTGHTLSQEGPEEARSQIALTEILVKAMKSITNRYLLPGSPSAAPNDKDDVDHGTKDEELSILKTLNQKRIYEFFLSTFRGKFVQRGDEQKGEHHIEDEDDMSPNSCVFSDVRAFETAKFSKTSSTPLWFEELFTSIKAQMYVGGGSSEKDGGTTTTGKSTLQLSPFASPECGVVLPPSHIAQCLLYALTTMSHIELARLSVEVAAAASASTTTFSSNSAERYNVFSPFFTKIFSRSLCARAATCVQWVYGTFVPVDAAALASSSPDLNNDNGDSTASFSETGRQRRNTYDGSNNDDEKEGLALLAHFGVELSSLPLLRPASFSSTTTKPTDATVASSLTTTLSPREKLRKFTFERSQWLASVRLTDMTPIVPLQRLVAENHAATRKRAGDHSIGDGDGGAKGRGEEKESPLFVMYDDRTERVKQVKSVRDVLNIPSRFGDYGGAEGGKEEEGQRGLKGVPVLAKGILTSSEITNILERFVWRSSTRTRTRTRATLPTNLATPPPDPSPPSGSSLVGSFIPAFPSLILFSGDSVLRSAFYELVSAIRNPLKVVVLPPRSSTLPPRTKKFGGQSWGSAYDGKIFYIRMNEHDALLSSIAHLNPEEANSKPKSSFSWPPTAATSNVDLKTQDVGRDGANAVLRESRKSRGRGVNIELDADASYPFAEIPFSFEELRVVYEPLFDQIVRDPMGHTETDLLRILRPVTGVLTHSKNDEGNTKGKGGSNKSSGGVAAGEDGRSENADTKDSNEEKVEGAQKDIRLRQRTFPAPWVLHQLKRVCFASTAAAATRNTSDRERRGDGSGERPSYLDGATRRGPRDGYGHLCPRFIVAFEFDNHAGNVYETFMPNAVSDIMNDWSTNPNEKWRGEGTRVAKDEKENKAGTPPPPTALPPTFIGAHIHSFGVWQHKETDIISRTHSYFMPLLFGGVGGGPEEENGLLCTNGAVWGGTALDRFRGSSDPSSSSSASSSSPPPSVLSFLDDKICFKNNNNYYRAAHHHHHSTTLQTLHISRITSGYKHINARDNDNDTHEQKKIPTTDSSSHHSSLSIQNDLSVSSDGHYSRALREAAQLFFGPLTQNTSSSSSSKYTRQWGNDEGKVGEGTVGRSCPPGGSALIYGGSVPARYQPLGAKVSADLLAKWGSLSASPPPAVVDEELSKLLAEPLPSAYYSHSFSSLSLCAHENKTVIGDDSAREMGEQSLGFDLETKDEILTKRLVEKAVAACLAGETSSSSSGGGQNAAFKNAPAKKRRRGGGKRKPDRQSWEYFFSKTRNPMAASGRAVHISKLSADTFVFLAHLEGLWRLREELYGIERGINGGNYSAVLISNRSDHRMRNEFPESEHDSNHKKRSSCQLDHFSELLNAYYSSTPEKIPITIPPPLLDQSSPLTSQQVFVRNFPPPQRQRIIDSLDHSDKLLQAAREAILKSLQGKKKKVRNELEPNSEKGRKRSHDDADADGINGNTNTKDAKASNPQHVLSPAKHYVYDAMKLQTLYPFASNDYLHFDCHFSVNARKAPWMRLEPRVSAPHAQLIEKMHHGLFTVIDDAYGEEDNDEENENRKKTKKVEEEGSSGSGVGSVADSSRLNNRNESSRSAQTMANLWSAPSGRAVPIHQPLCWDDSRPTTSEKQKSGAPHSSHISALFYNYFLRDVLNTVEGCEEWSLRTGGVLPIMTSSSASGKSTAKLSSASPECAVLITHNYNQCRNTFGANELSLILNRLNLEL